MTDFFTTIERIDAAFKAALPRIQDLTPTQSLLLSRMGDGKYLAGELKKKGLYTGTNVSYNLASLISRGLLKKRKDPNDRRISVIELTERGHQVKTEVDEAINEIMGGDIGKIIRGIDTTWARDVLGSLAIHSTE